MIECDNPKCSNVGIPEWEPPKKGGKKPITAPYSWYQCDVWHVGPGPNILAYACQLKCVGPAIDYKFEIEWRAEDDGN